MEVRFGFNILIPSADVHRQRLEEYKEGVIPIGEAFKPERVDKFPHDPQDCVVTSSIDVGM